MVEYPFKFQYTAAFEEFLEKNNISLDIKAAHSGIYKEGAEIFLKDRVLVEPMATLCKKSFFSIGAFSYSRSPFERIDIGRYCSISWRCEIMGIAHPIDRISTHLFTFRPRYIRSIQRRHGRAPDIAPYDAEGGIVRIGHDVWIGQDVLLKPGICIGNGAVVAAGAIVTKDVPPFAVVAGVPARIIKYRFDEALHERIQRVAWWRYHVADFAGLQTADPTTFLDGLEQRIAEGKIAPYEPGVIDLAEAIQQLPAAETSSPVGGS